MAKTGLAHAYEPYYMYTTLCTVAKKKKREIRIFQDMYYSMVAIEKMNSHEMHRQKDALSPKKYQSGFGFSKDLSYYRCEERTITRNNRKNY